MALESKNSAPPIPEHGKGREKPAQDDSGEWFIVDLKRANLFDAADQLVRIAVSRGFTIPKDRQKH